MKKAAFLATIVLLVSTPALAEEARTLATSASGPASHQQCPTSLSPDIVRELTSKLELSAPQMTPVMNGLPDCPTQPGGSCTCRFGSGDCMPDIFYPPNCWWSDTGLTACIYEDKALSCPTGQTIHRYTCGCVPTPTNGCTGVCTGAYSTGVITCQ
jgi:hypothetical protein